jgi:hypothetical protein
VTVAIVPSVSAGAASGTTGQTSGGAETLLATITAAGVYQLIVDTKISGNAMAGGTTPDVVRIRGYVKPTSGGTETTLFIDELPPGAQSKCYLSFPYPSIASIRFTIEQPAGTTRTMPYAVWQLA